MKQFITILILLSIIELGFSQQVPIHNQYLINKFAMSPAFAGLNGNIESFITYRQNWVGIEGAPQLQIMNINGSLSGESSGFGVQIMSEQTGSYRQFYADLTYAHHINLGTEMFLNFGLTPKVYRNQLDLTKVKSQGNFQDPVLQNNSTLVGTNFDIGVSVAFSAGSLYVGAEAGRTIGMNMNFKETTTQYTLPRYFTGFASYNIISETMQIEPMAIVRYSSSAPLYYEASVTGRFNQKLWASLSYSASSTIGVSAGFTIGERLVFNYTYEFGMGDGISSKSSGTHEVSIGFLIKSADKRRNPCIFAEPEEKPVEKNNKGNEEIEKRLKLAENKLKTEIEKKDKQIKDLDDRLKKLEGNVDKIEAGTWETPFIIENIKFGNQSDKLFPSSFPALDKLVRQMKKEPDWKIKIVGYTDNLGSPQYNLKLSERRAKAVKDYLVSKEIDDKRIIIEGKGQENPIGDNNSQEGRAMNRRIEAAWKK